MPCIMDRNIRDLLGEYGLSLHLKDKEKIEFIESELKRMGLDDFIMENVLNRARLEKNNIGGKGEI